MDPYLDSLGYSIANEDNIIKTVIHNIVEKENNIMKKYKMFIDLKNSIPEMFHTEIDKILEKKRLYLMFKMQNKQQQCNAIMKLLEYINELDSKDKHFESKKLLNKIHILEKQVSQYQQLLS